jgi:hypothetical protein
MSKRQVMMLISIAANDGAMYRLGLRSTNLSIYNNF